MFSESMAESKTTPARASMRTKTILRAGDTIALLPFHDDTMDVAEL
jgi:hypothetical protein